MIIKLYHIFKLYLIIKLLIRGKINFNIDLLFMDIINMIIQL